MFNFKERLFPSPEKEKFEKLTRIMKAIESVFAFTQPETRAILMGFIVEAKPGIVLGEATEEEAAAILKIFNKEGIDAKREGNLFVRPAHLRQRIALEPELARHVRWDPKKTIKDHLVQAMKRNPDYTLVSDALLGFILGYPKQALLHFEDLGALKSRGIGSEQDIQPDKRWSEQDRIELTRLQEELSPFIQAGDLSIREAVALHENTEKRAFARPETRHLYKRYLHATDEEYDLLANSESVHILSPLQEYVYTFVIPGNQKHAREEVKRLREHVKQSFEAYGFPYPEGVQP
jgi:hypothetical protein